MGASCTCNGELRDELSADKLICADLATDRRQKSEIRQLLFVGCKAVGKSTLIKQLRDLHGTSYTNSERLSLVPHLHHYVITSMQSLISKSNRAALSMEAQQAIVSLYEIKEDCGINEEISSIIDTLWSEPSIKREYEASMMNIYDQALPYFIDQLARIQEADYMPTMQDILRMPVLEKKLMQTRIQYTENFSPREWIIAYDLIYPCTQYTECWKFMHQFETVDALMFVADLSRYDVTIHSEQLPLLVYGFIDMFYDVMEIPPDLIALIKEYSKEHDEELNAMQQQIDLFDTFVNHRWYRHGPAIVLLLNKLDLFNTKVEKLPINQLELWCDYQADSTEAYEQARYFRTLFEETCTDRHRTIYSHLTCATDRGNVEKVFGDVNHVATQQLLSHS